MSTAEIDSQNRNTAKYTRGEKCIFIHVVVTILLILITVAIYLLHLYYVSHTLGEIIYPISVTNEQYVAVKTSVPVGIIYVNITPPVVACNIVLFHKIWSFAPGHCVAIRSEPDMANLLYSWRVKYEPDIDVEVKRSVVHPSFNRNTLANNIGLFQHSDVLAEKFIFSHPTPVYNTNMEIGSFVGGVTEIQNFRSSFQYYTVHPMPSEQCLTYVSPILDLRSYEYCVIFSKKQDVDIEFGALVLADSKIIGFFSWGERNQKHLPFVILNISYYEDWLTRLAY